MWCFRPSRWNSQPITTWEPPTDALWKRSTDSSAEKDRTRPSAQEMRRRPDSRGRTKGIRDPRGACRKPVMALVARRRRPYPFLESCPAKTPRPPASCSGPQTKQVRNRCVFETAVGTRSRLRLPKRWGFWDIELRFARPRLGEQSTIANHGHPDAVSITSNSTSRGGGTRSRTRAGPSTNSASRPHV